MVESKLKLKDKYAKQDQALFDAVARLKDGDMDAFSTVYELSERYIYSIIWNIMKNDESTADIMQEVYIIIYRKIHLLEANEAFLQWAGRIATRECYQYLRKSKREVLVYEDEEDDDISIFDTLQEENEDLLPEELALDNEHKKLILEIIDRLPALQKLTIMHYYYNDLSVNEIAEEMECSPGTVKSRLNYARKQIKSEIVELDKKYNTRLYSFGTLPLLWLLLREEVSRQVVPQVVRDQVLTNVIKSASHGNITGNIISKASNYIKKSWKKLAGATAVVGTTGAIVLNSLSTPISQFVSFDNVTPVSRTVALSEEYFSLYSEYEQYLYNDKYIIIMNEEGKEGVIDLEGNFITECKWDRIIIDSSTGPLIKVELDYKEGYIDLNGDLIGGQLWEYVYEVTEDNIFLVEDENYIKHYYHTNGKRVVETGFKNAENFINGIGVALKEDGWGAINTSGQTIIDFKYMTMYYEGDDPLIVASINEMDYSTLVFDLEGNIVNKYEWPVVAFSGYKDGCAQMGIASLNLIDFNTDVDGNILFEYDSTHYLEPYENGVAIYRNENFEYTLVDKYGSPIIDEVFEYIKDLEDGFGIVETFDNQCGVIRTDGTYLIEPAYDSIDKVKPLQLFICYKDNQIGVVNYEGEEIIGLTAANISVVGEDVLILTYEDNQKLYYNSKGELLTKLSSEDNYYLSNFVDDKAIKVYYDYELNREIVDVKGNTLIKSEGECYLLEGGYYIEIIDNTMYLKKF